MKSLQVNKEKYYDDIYKAFDHNDRATFRELFLRLHDRDQHELYHLLYPEKKRKIGQFLSPQEFAELFEWMELEDKEQIIENLSPDYIAEMFNHVANDDVLEFFNLSEVVDPEEILSMMEEEEASRVRELMSYAEDTAGSIMTKEFISIKDYQTAANVLENLRELSDGAETIYYLYVLNEDGQLVGVLSLRDLLLAQDHELVRDIMFDSVTSVRIDMDQEEVAGVIRDYDLLALPVLSHDGRMQGIVTVDDIMDIIEEEAAEDIIEFAAIRPSDTEETEVTVLGATKQRVPWILILLILGLITGSVISYFEETLESVVILAGFMPMIMGTAGNIGTQSLAVAVKNMDNSDDDSSIFSSIKQEVLGSLIIGTILSIFIFVLAVVVYRNLVLAGIVSSAVFLATIMSASVGTLFPLLFAKINIDPAVASGPFITTTTDILALVIYFAIATSFLQYL